MPVSWALRLESWRIPKVLGIMLLGMAVGRRHAARRSAHSQDGARSWSHCRAPANDHLCCCARDRPIGLANAVRHRPTSNRLRGWICSDLASGSSITTSPGAGGADGAHQLYLTLYHRHRTVLRNRIWLDRDTTAIGVLCCRRRNLHCANRVFGMVVEPLRSRTFGTTVAHVVLRRNTFSKGRKEMIRARSRCPFWVGRGRKGWKADGKRDRAAPYRWTRPLDGTRPAQCVLPE